MQTQNWRNWYWLPLVIWLVWPHSTQAAFNQNIVLDDAAFVNKDAYNEAQIQSFLVTQGSFLAGYRVENRSAANVIYQAAQDNNLNPQVILATLQKEQSLIGLSSYNTETDPDGKLRKAAGYGCPDSGGCDSRYAGFIKQVDGVAFQLRYNFDCSQAGGACPTSKLFKASTGYRVGDTMTFDGIAVTISNRATASLYRYTPHVSGNRSFYNYFFSYFIKYASLFSTQNPYPTLAPGDSYRFEAKYLNTGNLTWTPQFIKLTTAGPAGRVSPLARENQTGDGQDTQWSTETQVALLDRSIAPGQLGTFAFYYTAPVGLKAGTYREGFSLTSTDTENKIIEDQSGLFWDVTVKPHEYATSSQNFGRQRVEPGQSVLLELKLLNSGQTTWRRDSRYPVRLATDRRQDRTPEFIREDRQNNNPSGWISENRIQLVESTVAPGALGTFRFYYTVPADMKPGLRREYFRPVHDGIGPMSADYGIYFELEVGAQRASWASQSANPTLSRGQSAQFTVKFRNEGTTAWQRDGERPMRLATLRPNDRALAWIREDVPGGNASGFVKENRIQMVESTVAPGAEGTFTFWLTVPGDKAAGTYREYFGLVQDGYATLPDQGVYWDITVR